MTSIEEYTRLRQPVEGVATLDIPRKAAPTYPHGWEPGVETNGAGGVIVTEPQESNPIWDDLLTSWGLDPELFEVIEPVTMKAWDGWCRGPDGEITSKRLYSYKATLRRRVAPADRADVDLLIEEIRRHKARKRPAPEGEQSFIVSLADWQMGVGRGGGVDGPGSEAIVQAILEMGDAVVTRYRELRRVNRRLEQLTVLGLGDLVEGCDGSWYAMQQFQADLDNRDQLKVVRRLLRDLISRWSRDFQRVVVAAVGGNHGEQRKDGKAFTTFADNSDVAVFETVAEVFAANPETYGHVHFVLPTDQLSLVLDVCGTLVGFSHGHLAGKGGNASAAVQKWWEGQAFGQLPVGDATLLITGHRHHLSITQQGGRTHVQAPAMDNGSLWFTNVSGLWSPTGTLTLVTGNGEWSDLAVVR